MNGDTPSDDLVADFHAGALPDDEARRVREMIDRDPHAARTLAGLDALVRDLRGLGEAPDETPMPGAVTARMHDALAGLPPVSDAGDVGDVGDVRETEVLTPGTASLAAARRRRLAWASGGIAAAAAVVAAVVLPTLGGPGLDGGEQTPSAPPLAAPTGPALDLGSDIQPGRIMSLLGSDDPGLLADPDRLAGCLSANGIDPDVTPLGSRQVTIGGIPATLLLLPGSEPPSITALAVGQACAAGEPDLVVRREIG